MAIKQGHDFRKEIDLWCFEQKKKKSAILFQYIEEKADILMTNISIKNVDLGIFDNDTNVFKTCFIVPLLYKLKECHLSNLKLESLQ